MTVTILTGEPLGGNAFPGGTMKLNFGGSGTPGSAASGPSTRSWLGQPPGTLVTRVPYPASMTKFSIPDGVVSLDRMIKRTSGDLLVFGHSQFCQVVSRWLRTLAQEPDAPDPERVRFLLIGNPLRKYGGFGVGRKEFDSKRGQVGLATPTDSPYEVEDVKLQYDGWADHPTLPGTWAHANAAADRYLINGNRAIHAWGYRSANLNDPKRKTYVEGTTTYVMIPHAPLLMVPRSRIEQGYNRPET